MSITATELKLNLCKYLQMAKSLLGVIPADITLEEAKAERANIPLS